MNLKKLILVRSEILGLFVNTLTADDNFRQPFGSQHASASRTLVKSARHHLHTTALLILDHLKWKKVLLVQPQILRLFVKALTADDKYSCHKRKNFLSQINMQLSQKPKTFSRFFTRFLKPRSNFQYLEDKVRLID